MIPHLQPYPAYKDSGVAWLGDVPEHWEVHRLKSKVANLVDQTATRETGELYVRLEDVESWTGRYRPPEDDVEFDSQVKRFRPDDVLFGKLRPYLAKVIRPTESGVCVGEFLVLRTRSTDLHPGYLEQSLRSRPFIGLVDSSTFGAKMPRADWGFIASVAFPFPSRDEQAAIVRFLDYVGRRVRRYVRAKRRLIDLLNEQKQAVIQRAVTRGLDPTVRLKPSGVDWLGDIPKHWEVMALRFRYMVELGKMLDTKRITGEHLVPYLRNVDVRWDEIRTDDLPEMDVGADEYARYTLEKGDLLVCEGGEVGRAAIWGGSIRLIAYQKALHRVRPINGSGDQPRYLMFVLETAASRGVFLAEGSENTFAHLTSEKLRRHRFAFPPPNEQKVIVECIDEALIGLTESESLVKNEMELITEYRTRLIADVVTGKLDVREAAAALPDEPDEELGEVSEDAELGDELEEELEMVAEEVEA